MPGSQLSPAEHGAPGARHEVLRSPSSHVQLALVQVAGPTHRIEPQPYLRVSLNTGPSYVIDATGSQGRQTLTCRRGSLLVIPPDTTVIHHAGLPKPAGRAYVPAQLATFRISRELVADCAIAMGLQMHQAQIEHQVIPPDDVMRALAQALLAELRAHCPDGAEAAERTAHALVAHVLMRQRKSGPTAAAAAIELVKQRVEEKLHEPLSLDALAALAGMSVFHFCRVFRERLGITPHQYILARRMERAQRLLWEMKSRKEGAASVLEVALACGFTSPSHFAAQFKRHTGFTPLQWSRGQGIPVQG